MIARGGIVYGGGSGHSRVEDGVHAIRQPLSAISLSLAALKRRVGNDEMAVEIVREMNADLARIEGMLHEMLGANVKMETRGRVVPA